MIFPRKGGLFEQLEELFENWIYNNTVHTNTLCTLPLTVIKPVHRLSKASRCSLTLVSCPDTLGHETTLTPVWAPKGLPKASRCFLTPFELCRDCWRLVHVQVWQPLFELCRDCRKLVSTRLQPLFKLHSDSSILVDIQSSLLDVRKHL